ncbi:MAG: hypothetical protein K2W95_15420 [Candidatus Obscuribacterales bacterium]|nr:hypothetical protein [Candidatus Obscuribacterales bacterium]
MRPKFYGKAIGISAASSMIMAQTVNPPLSATADPDLEVIQGSKDAKWQTPLPGQKTDSLLVFTRAITGKETKESTNELLNGVTEMSFLDEGLMFTRSDNARLLIAKTSDEGAVLTQDWEKAKRNAEKQFGPSGRAFLSSIQSIRRQGDRIAVVRTDEELLVELGQRKLHKAFDLKAIRFGSINFTLGQIQGKPALTDIDGVTVLVNAPGLTIPVHVKQFCKWKKPSGETDITVGIKTPVPGAVRAMLFLPKVVSFHFVMPKKKEDQESQPANANRNTDADKDQYTADDTTPSS